MPELPEIETVRRMVEPQVRGRRIVSADVRDAKLVESPSAEEVSERLAGQTVESLSRRGKFLVWHLGSGDLLVFHFRMTGQMVVSPPGPEAIGHVRLALTLDDGGTVLFGDMRRFARIWLVAPGEDDPTGMDRLGVEPDDPRLGWRYLRDSLGGRGCAVKTGLLDQSAVAGLGNIYSDEVLFRARVNPLTPCRDVTVPQWKRIASEIPRMMCQAVECNAMTPEEYLATGGMGYRTNEHLSVYGRKGRPCPVCGRPIVRSAVCGRGSYWCPGCQPSR